ncbi:hypothetical protein [Paraburkholderia acidipaludis]|uniref:hypothetical protein n=1 Tax=Paraburkholderia acidipaludis TaxID=660537 RepID=UPI000483CC93
MKVWVAVKCVMDANVKVRVKPDKSGVGLANARIVKAKEKPQETVRPENSVWLSRYVRRCLKSSKRSAGLKVLDAKTLVETLKTEAKAL